MFVYFLVHIPATVLMDVVPLYPSFIQALIKPLMDLQGNELHLTSTTYCPSLALCPTK